MKILLFTFCILFAFAAGAQDDEVTLRIGDEAPAMKYSQWIKGKPVTKFKGDQLYVLEFWATWCGPCKAAMPHLTKTQKAYEGKVNIIGVDVWEKVKEGEKYETVLPYVEKFVKGNDANMGYSVVADNNDQHMGKKWLKAAGQNGIPSTFIIKDKKIIWIGHPMKLDSTLELITAGKYNMQDYKVTFEKKNEESRKMIAGMRAGQKKVDDVLKTKDYKKAFEVMEEVKKEAPILKISMEDLKFKTLLKYVSHDEAKAYANEWAKTFKSAPQYVMMAVSAEEGLPKDMYLWAVKNFESTNPANTNPMVFHMMAGIYAKGRDYKSAIANEEKAVEGAKTALKEGKMIGSIMDYTVTEYEEALAGYKKAGGVAKAEL